MRRPSLFRRRSPPAQSPLGARVAPPLPDPPPGPGGPSCGADAPSGLVLFRVRDAAGRAARPSLALAGPDGAVRGRVHVPHPREILPTPSGCRAVVRSADGGTFVVDGATGTVRELDLDGRADDWRYEWRAGGGRWGLFKNRWSPVFPDRCAPRSALIDFATGQVTDLHAVDDAAFSPDGEALLASVYVGEDRRLWLIPARDPRRFRAVGGETPIVESFDGGRLLYTEFDTDRVPYDYGLELRARGVRHPFRRGQLLVNYGEWVLIVEDAAGGARVELARTGAGLPRGWFLPGRPEVAVTFPDRFAVVDPGGGIPRELFSLDGAFHIFYPAPSGRRAILEAPSVAGIVSDAEDESDAEVVRTPDPELTFVDFERGTARRLTGDGGEPVRIEAVGWTGGWPGRWLGRWILLSVGGDEDAPRALAALDTETGATSPLLALAGRPQEVEDVWPSADGRTVLLARRGDGGTARLSVLDLERGTATEVAEARAISADLSTDGRWAAYAASEDPDGGRPPELTLLETATGATTRVGPGQEPVWLAP